MESKNSFRRLEYLLSKLDAALEYFLRSPHGIYAVNDYTHILLSALPSYVDTSENGLNTRIEAVKKKLSDALALHREAMHPNIKPLDYTENEWNNIKVARGMQQTRSREIIQETVIEVNNLAREITRPSDKLDFALTEEMHRAAPEP